MDEMNSIASSAVAGVIAGLTVTAILAIASCVRRCSARRQDIRTIREILLEGRKRVLKAEDTPDANMNTTIPGDALRAAQYNNMIKKLSVVLEKWPTHLTNDQRKDVFEALDWHKTDSLKATKNKLGQVTFVELPEGRWPYNDMRSEFAEEKFSRLKSIKWLCLYRTRFHGHKFVSCGGPE